MDAGAVAQLDAAQAELEAGNAALLQGAPFLVEMLALQAAAPGMGPVSALNPFETFSMCFLECTETRYVMGLERHEIPAECILDYPEQVWQAAQSAGEQHC